MPALPDSCAAFPRGAQRFLDRASCTPSWRAPVSAREANSCAPCDWHADGARTAQLSTRTPGTPCKSPIKRAAIPPLAGRREPHSRHLERMHARFIEHTGLAARPSLCEHADAQIEEASAEYLASLQAEMVSDFGREAKAA